MDRFNAARASKSGYCHRARLEDVSAKVLVNCPSTGRSYRVKRKFAEKKVARGRFRWVDNFTVEEIPALDTQPTIQVFWDGPFGVGNAIPFSRVLNKLCAPPKLHYAMPAAGAKARRVCAACINGLDHIHGGRTFENSADLLEPAVL